ncbi:MAG TPA: DNA polymerase III subunit alpha, partial [Sedimentisphaerales bacterium]|nr:DNA polymerase III subunit alpha [Sedimentisphaerales bacterium]
SIDKLIKKCQTLDMPAVAVTDHGNMFGALEFYTKAKAAEIKPIIGCEVYISPDSRFNKQKASMKDASYHLILLAMNGKGYKNLIKLTSIAYTEGFYYRPRIDKEILSELNEGLICSSACISGEIARLLTKGDEEGAKEAAQSYLNIFDDRFYIEIQTHENDDTNARPALIELANKMSIPLVATNDAHFLDADDYEAHNCLCCIGTGKMANDPDRMIYPRDLYVKSSQEMRNVFSDVPQACDNTLEIAKRCNVEIDTKTRHAPVFVPDDGSTPEEFLTRICNENAKKLYGEITEEIDARIKRELEVIEGKGFSSYFLINWELCKWAHDNHIPVGARGSGVGTIVGYCLGLCNVDPLKYDLLFERFMDPDRDEMPDIDIDMCQANRQRLIDYVRDKYGYVAQITTMGTMKAKGVIRDVCRVKNIPLPEADRLAKLVPDDLKMTLEKAIEAEPDLKEIYETNSEIREVIDICKKLEGLARHSSVHACGLVIAQEPLETYIPVYKAAGSDDLITQYEGSYVEKAGLLKMDFLGLKTLSVLARARDLIQQIHGVEIDLDKINIEDPQVFELFSNGNTKGVFQFESGGMQDLLMKMKPDRIEDLIAANALYRPGPMTLIPDYIARKHGEKWTTPHQILTEVLQETYGIMIYQEQIMRIANRLGDVPLREAYTMIKAISKKKLKVIESAKEKFIEGCLKKNLTAEQAEEIFALIERFAGYGFNKSHSTRYAFIAYQTAWLKTHYPVEFMAALLTYDGDNTEKVVDYISECKKMGIEILAPDINESMVDFTPLYKDAESKAEKKGIIRFGLAAVKGIGEKAVEQIIKARQQAGKFKTLHHFCENVDMRAANKQVVEALIKAGAFDRLGGNRAQMMAGLESAMQVGSSLQADKVNGQMNFFDRMTTEEQKESESNGLPNVDPWPEQQMLAFEKQVLGFYVTSNPLSKHAEIINVYSSVNSSQLENCSQDKEIIIGGMITKIRQIVTKNGRNAGSKMAVFVLEDLQGEAEVVVFPKTLAKQMDHLVEDKIVFVKGTVDCKREKPNIFAEELIAIEDVTEKLAAKVNIQLFSNGINKETLGRIKTLCQRHKGRSSFCITIQTDKGRVCATADKSLSVNPDIEFCRMMKSIVGKENFTLSK